MINPLVERLLESASCLQQPAYLTLSVIHPTQRRRVPSRHIAVDDRRAIADALQRIRRTNRMGWGAYVGIGYRSRPLTRYRRGGRSDILALPAIFADIERPPEQVWPLLHTVPEPGLVVASGGGTHLYWFLKRPTPRIRQAEQVLTGLARWLGADTTMTADQIMRLPGSINTKPQRRGARCRVLTTTGTRYSLDDFFPYEILSTPRRQPAATRTSRRTRARTTARRLNPRLAEAVLHHLRTYYDAIPRGNGWHACLCPFPHRRDRYPGDHAFYRPDIGLFNCFGKHGQYLLKDIADCLGISAVAQGGLYQST
jgi:hypothetical protein